VNEPARINGRRAQARIHNNISDAEHNVQLYNKDFVSNSSVAAVIAINNHHDMENMIAASLHTHTASHK
jgi:hypothetical protein